MKKKDNKNDFDKLLESLGETFVDEISVDRPHELELFSSVPLEQDLYYTIGNYGYQDNTGTVVISPKYIIAGEFYNGLAVVVTKYHKKKNGHIEVDEYNFIDVNDKKLCKSGFLYALPFNDYGVAFVRFDDSKVGLIDKFGKVLSNSISKNYSIEKVLNADIPLMLTERYFEAVDENDNMFVYDTLEKSKITDKDKMSKLRDEISYKFKSHTKD